MSVPRKVERERLTLDLNNRLIETYYLIARGSFHFISNIFHFGKNLTA